MQLSHGTDCLPCPSLALSLSALQYPADTVKFDAALVFVASLQAMLDNEQRKHSVRVVIVALSTLESQILLCSWAQLGGSRRQFSASE